MSTVIPEPAQDISINADYLYRMDVEQYHALVESGVFTENNEFELLGGMLVKKMTKKPLHVFVFNTLWNRLSTQLPKEFTLRLQDPISLANSEPEPDLAIIRGTNSDFRQQHPTGSDCELIVEVSDSSLKLDQGAKKTIYANACIPEYWIVNLVEKCIEVYREPAGGTYSTEQKYLCGETVSLKLTDELTIQIHVSELF